MKRILLKIAYLVTRRLGIADRWFWTREALEEAEHRAEELSQLLDSE